MKSRLKEVRKSLKLTMEDFGSKMGVTRSAISNIENGYRNLTEQMIVAVCNTYNVNEEWLREGKGEMFAETKESYMENLAKQYALDDKDIILIQAFLELDPDQRAVIKEYVKNVAVISGYNKTAEELEKERIDAEVESYRRELEAEAKGAEELSVLPDTEENSENKKEAK